MNLEVEDIIIDSYSRGWSKKIYNEEEIYNEKAKDKNKYMPLITSAEHDELRKEEMQRKEEKLEKLRQQIEEAQAKLKKEQEKLAEEQVKLEEERKRIEEIKKELDARIKKIEDAEFEKSDVARLM